MRDHEARLGTLCASPGLVAAALMVIAGAVSPVLEMGEGAAQTSVAGRWDMSLNDTYHKCRLVLRDDASGAAHALAMPAGCRRAMPILSSVGGWTTASSGLELTDTSGSPVLQFSPKSDASEYTATGPEGETYVLAAADHAARMDATPARSGTQVAQAGPPAPGVAMAPPAGPPINPNDLPGRYDIYRAGQRDTGCMLTLDDRAKGPKGGRKAILAPACRDQGIVIFDPAGWKVERNRLVLVAKKGHEAHLDFQADGSWLKDPKEGPPLILKKM
jgi:hypothetical protein